MWRGQSKPCPEEVPSLEGGLFLDRYIGWFRVSFEGDGAPVLIIYPRNECLMSDGRYPGVRRGPRSTVWFQPVGQPSEKAGGKVAQDPLRTCPELTPDPPN